MNGLSNSSNSLNLMKILHLLLGKTPMRLMTRINSCVVITGYGCLLIWIISTLGHVLHNGHRKLVTLSTSGTGSSYQGVIAYNVNYKQFHAILSPINQLKLELDLVVLVPTHYTIDAAGRRRVIRKTWANKTYTSPLKVQHVFVLGKFTLSERFKEMFVIPGVKVELKLGSRIETKFKDQSKIYL